MDLSKITSKHFETALNYARAIVDCKILANLDRRLACERFLKDLTRTDIDFRQEQFDFVINLIEGTIHHVQGEDRNGISYKGQPLLLTDWQKFVCVNLFGFFEKDSDIRRFKEALIFLPRKQGKTAFSAALTEAKSILDRRSGSKAYIVANSVKQTLECFNFLVDNVNELKVLPDGPSGAELIIPDIIVNRIRERIGDFTTLYPLVDKVIAKGRVKLILDVDTSEATWLEMRGALPEEDDSKLTAVEFDGFKIGRIVYIDNSLLEDSVINLDDYLTKRIARSIAKGLDKAIDVRSNQIAANTMKEVTKLRSLVERIQDVVFPKEDVVITEGGVPDVSN